MRDQEYAWMARLEEDFWWYRGMREILQALTGEIPHAGLQKFLDAGCGTGFNLSWMPTWIPLAQCIGLDLSEQALGFCREKAPGSLVRGDISRLPFGGERFDLLTSLDIIQNLPQLPDVRRALEEFHRVLRPGGWLILRTVAYDFLRSRHDAAVHSNRRFTARFIGRATREAGFEVQRITYANTLLFPVALIRRLATRASRGEAVSDVRPVPPWMNKIFYHCLAWEAGLLRAGIPRLPFGLSIVCVVQKPL